MSNISSSDLEIIKNAKQVLETDSIAQRISAIASQPLDELMGNLPAEIRNEITKWVNVSLQEASGWAMATTGTRKEPILRDDWFHRLAVIATGVWGGFGGIASTVAELPISTMLMLRSIGCIAEEEGHNASSAKIRLGCIAVLSMGSDPKTVKGDELGYWVAKNAVGALVTQAAEWGGKGTVPVLARFLVEVGKKFGLVISAKVAAQAAPVAGALAGATINHFFLEHYQAVAHAHFGLDRLCLQYGEAAVKDAYSS